MFSMCSELTPRARIPDTRIPQLMQPWKEPGAIITIITIKQSIEIESWKVKESKNKKEPGAMGKLIKVEHGLVLRLHSSISFYLLPYALRCKYALLNLDITSRNLLNATFLVVFIGT